MRLRLESLELGDVGHLNLFRVSGFGFRIYGTRGARAACCDGAAMEVIRRHAGVAPMRVAKSPLFAGLWPRFLPSAWPPLPLRRIGSEPSIVVPLADPLGPSGGGCAAWRRRRCRHPAARRSGLRYTSARQRSDVLANTFGSACAGPAVSSKDAGTACRAAGRTPSRRTARS
jgi:hypothetical protein